MTEQQFQEWHAALKENRYKKGYGLLQYKEDKETSYCMLGVFLQINHLTMRYTSLDKYMTFEIQRLVEYQNDRFGNRDNFNDDAAWLLKNKQLFVTE